MALPHPQSRKDHYGQENIAGWPGVVRQFFKRTVNVTGYRNSKDDVNPAKNHTLVHGLLHSLCGVPANVIELAIKVYQQTIQLSKRVAYRRLRVATWVFAPVA